MKWILALNASVFLFFGIFSLYSPVGLMSLVGVFMSPTGAIEIRTMYGGLELGIAVFLFLCVRRNWLEAGIWFSALSLGGMFACRLIFLLFTDGGTPILWKTNLAEGLATVLNVWAALKLQRVSKSQTQYERIAR